MLDEHLVARLASPMLDDINSNSAYHKHGGKENR
jgi:hypothetical protein